MPVAVTLLQWICVGSCMCPSYRNVSIMILVYFAFKNSAPSYASSTNAATNLSIWNSANIAPFRWMGCLYCGFHPRKKFPAARLCASLDDKYDASEWTFSIMANA